MGSLTDNLLKLTDFPFSYSFISLLVLILGGQGLLNEELSLANLGPLLIIMGFVATTLSIIDPIGVLQKKILKGSNRESSESFRRRELEADEVKDKSEKERLRQGLFQEFKKQKLFGKELVIQKEKLAVVDKLVIQKEKLAVVDKRKDESPPQHIGAPTYFPMNLKSTPSPPLPPSPPLDFRESEEDEHHRESHRESEEANSLFQSRALRASLSYDFLRDFSGYGHSPTYEVSFEKMKYNQWFDVYLAVLSLRDSTLGTKWVTREIDKITSMIYFIMVVSLFIYALIASPNDFQDRFVVAFQGGIQTGGSSVTGEDSLAAIKWIIVFSMIALGAVIYKLIIRSKELRENARMACRYLMVRLAFLIARRANKKLENDEDFQKRNESFQKSLEEVEQKYLENSDWAMARLWVHQLIQDYRDWFNENFKPNKD